MAHALAEFIDKRMQELELRQRDVVAASGLSRSLVSKQVNDQRDQISRLPERATLEGFARALRVPVAVLLAKAVESLGLGYQAGDFINELTTSDDQDLLDEIARRLQQAKQTSNGDTNVITLGTGSGTTEALVSRVLWDRPSGPLIAFNAAFPEIPPAVVRRAIEDLDPRPSAVTLEDADGQTVGPVPADAIHQNFAKLVEAWLISEEMPYREQNLRASARKTRGSAGKTEAAAADARGTESQSERTAGRE